MESVELPLTESGATDWVNLILNWGIITLGITLIILVLSFGLGDCDKLDFEVNNKTLNAGQFMDYYAKECLNPKVNTSLPHLSYP